VDRHEFTAARTADGNADVVLEELESAGQGGGLLGFPLMRIKVTVLGGEVGESGLSEIAFRTAANHCLRPRAARRPGRCCSNRS